MIQTLQPVISHGLKQPLPHIFCIIAIMNYLQFVLFFFSSSFVCLLSASLRFNSAINHLLMESFPDPLSKIEVYILYIVPPLIIALSLYNTALMPNPWRACFFLHAPSLLSLQVYNNLKNKDNVLLVLFLPHCLPRYLQFSLNHTNIFRINQYINKK